ncbi:hypothetical protein F5141DRAFT_1062801 [Pisolithus sp. B1]|nr:hypothetical protein F5141DRAFT_1062801 [Pisolithus sp. B1]
MASVVPGHQRSSLDSRDFPTSPQFQGGLSGPGRSSALVLLPDTETQDFHDLEKDDSESDDRRDSQLEIQRLPILPLGSALVFLYLLSPYLRLGALYITDGGEPISLRASVSFLGWFTRSFACETPPSETVQIVECMLSGAGNVPYVTPCRLCFLAHHQRGCCTPVILGRFIFVLPAVLLSPQPHLAICCEYHLGPDPSFGVLRSVLAARHLNLYTLDLVPVCQDLDREATLVGCWDFVNDYILSHGVPTATYFGLKILARPGIKPGSSH